MSSVTPPPSPATSGGGGIVPPPSPPKDPILIAVLNLLVAGGLGYFLMGQKTKGIVAIIAWIVLLVPPSCGTLSAVLAIVTAIDGYLQSQLQQQGKNLGEWTFFNDHK
jgi:hypothetical protein